MMYAHQRIHVCSEPDREYVIKSLHVFVYMCMYTCTSQLVVLTFAITKHADHSIRHVVINVRFRHPANQTACHQTEGPQDKPADSTNQLANQLTANQQANHPTDHPSPPTNKLPSSQAEGGRLASCRQALSGATLHAGAWMAGKLYAGGLAGWLAGCFVGWQSCRSSVSLR